MAGGDRAFFASDPRGEVRTDCRVGQRAPGHPRYRLADQRPELLRNRARPRPEEFGGLQAVEDFARRGLVNAFC